MSVEINKRIATGFITRSTHLGFKGKRREAAALEYLCGACTALGAVLGIEHDDVKHAEMMVFMVSVRGYAELVQFTTVEAKPQVEAA